MHASEDSMKIRCNEYCVKFFGTKQGLLIFALIIVQRLFAPVHSLLLSRLSLVVPCLAWASSWLASFPAMGKTMAWCFYLLDCFMLETDVPFCFPSFLDCRVIPRSLMPREVSFFLYIQETCIWLTAAVLECMSGRFRDDACGHNACICVNNAYTKYQ